MPEEKQDYQGDDDDLFDQFLFESSDRVLYQFRAVVSWDDFDAFGEKSLDFLDLIFYALNNVIGVFPLTHNDHASDRIAPAIEIGYAASQITCFADRSYSP